MKDEITFDRQAVNTLDELITQAININNKLFEQVMEKHHDRRYSHPAWHVSNHYKPPRPATTRTSTWCRLGTSGQSMAGGFPGCS